MARVGSLGGTYLFPIWLSHANGVIEDAGYDAKLVDASAKEWGTSAVKNDIDAFDPDIVVIESNFSNIKNDIDVIGQLKQDRDFLSVLVGPPASQFLIKVPSEPRIGWITVYVRCYVCKCLDRPFCHERRFFEHCIYAVDLVLDSLA